MTEEKEKVYTIKTPQFEGPLDLLLSLVEERKLFVNDVSLATVTDDYIAYLKAKTDMDIGEATGFVIVAATLMLIKSKSLLPNFNLTPEETENIADLEARLMLYQVIREISVSIKENFGKEIMFPAPERHWNEPMFIPDARITAQNMRELAEAVISAIPKKEILQEISVRKVVSLEEMMEDLSERIGRAVSMSFKDFSGYSGAPVSKEEKINIVVSFLAMLELVRGGLIDVLQQASFGDMRIEKQTEKTVDM